MKHVFALASLLLVWPATAQTIAGCGAAAISKVEARSQPKLKANADCFGRAAAGATKARDARVALLLPTPIPDPAPTPAPSATGLKIGTNLAPYAASYFGASYPLIDRFRTAAIDGWNAVSTTGANLGMDPVHVVAGTGLPGTQRADIAYMTTLFNIDPASTAKPARYVITWQGAGELSVGFGRARDVAKGNHRYTFSYADESNQGQLLLSGTSDADPLREVHIVREDQAAAFAAGQVFSPAFLARTSPWAVLRFMDWGATVNSPAVRWSDLNSGPSDGVAKGVSLSTMVALANANDSDMWWCVPAKADDDLVRRAVTYIRDNLSQKHALHLEYSNEMWNYGFPDTHWAQAKGVDPATWAAYPGVIPSEMGAGGWYGLRSAQIAKISEEVFGAQSKARLRNVLGTQAYWFGLEGYLLKGVKAGWPGKVGDLFEEWAIAPYFGGHLQGETDDDKAKVLGWARSGAAGLDAAFKELADGGVLRGDQSLVKAKEASAYHAKVAAELGLTLVAYEGGTHIIATGYAAGKDRDDIVDLHRRLLADPRMSALYTRYLHDFEQVGGKLFLHYNDIGGTSQWGGWGALDDVYQTSKPRYDALVAAAGTKH